MEAKSNKLCEQKQVFLPLKPHYNLRNTKSTTPTTVFLVFNINGKQYKINTGVKCYPEQWNKKQYKAMVSVILSELENKNNMLINAKIQEFNHKYQEFILYLCNNLEEIDNPTNAIYTIFGMKQKKKKELLSAVMLKALNNANIKESSYKIFNGILKEFLQWCGSSATLDDVNLDMFKAYKQYLFSQSVQHKITKEIVAPDNVTVINKLTALLTCFTYLNDEKFEPTLNKMRKILKEIKKTNASENQVYLTDEDIAAIEAVELSGLEDNVRDVFLFQISSGQRFSDIKKLMGKDLSAFVQGGMISIVQKKTGASVAFPIDDRARRILKKYNYILPQVASYDADKLLKGICKKAGINDICYCSELRGDKVYEYQCEKWQLIGTHTARRSFVSTNLKKGIDANVLRKVTGHKSAAFDKYNRLSASDAVNVLLGTSGTSGKASGTASTVEGGTTVHNNNFKTLQRVLTMLNVNPLEWIDVDNEEQLYRLIVTKENEIETQTGCGYQFLKELFNSPASLKEKAEILQSMLNK